MTRSESLERLASKRFDLLVVGAGITGARIAYEAARVGLHVALVDAGDIASGTSSASSKLLHGGFRYLSLGSYGLVRSAQIESRLLATRIAPHLSRPLSVVLAMERGRWPEWQLSCGVLFYFGLSGFRPPRPRLLDASQVASVAPHLRMDGDRIHVLLHEFQTDDGRLVLATAAGAAEAGAVVAPYVDVLALGAVNGRLDRADVIDRLGHEPLVVHARCIVNATGASIDRLRRLESAAAQPIVRLSKGVHVTLPLPGELPTLVAFYSSDDRTSFAAPWHGTLLLGATDTDYDGDPREAQASEDDVAELLAGGRRLLGDHIAGEPILSAWAGLRVLPRKDGDTARVPREHVTMTGARGMISVAGGKLTTHRRIAAEVIASLPSELRPRRLRRPDDPLPGATPTAVDVLDASLDALTARHLRSLYGSGASALLVYSDIPEAFERIHPDAPDVWAQVIFAGEREWAYTVEDVLWRRTTLAHRGLATERVRESVARCLSAPEARASIRV